MTPDEVEEAIAENIRLGYIEAAGVNEDGEPVYRVSDAGKAHLRSLMETP